MAGDTAASRTNQPPIGDYAAIGDCRSAALVSRDGSIDWLCLPRFDSPSVFAAILDTERGGRFSVRPAGRYEVHRRYVDDSNVLETTFHTDSGVVRLVDLMPVTSETEKRRELWPNHQLLRIVECLDGEVEIEAVCDPRPDYGRTAPRPVDRGAFGFRFGSASSDLIARSEIPLAPRPGAPGLAGRATLRRGEQRHLSLTYNPEEPAVVAPFGEAAERKVRQTVRWWQDWAARCQYAGPYRDDVIRSTLVLKLMTYAPSGAVIAAPTASLPEWIGGVRNWDYRYCWLRDASLTLRALFEFGHATEGEAFLNWMLHATRLTWPELQVMYDVYGETRLKERELEHLAGYAGSRPVRVGNAAAHQFQLDLYGDVVEAAYEYVERGGRLDREATRMLVGLGKTVCRRWREPDEGIWEIRAGTRHHTHSKAMCWLALDRLVRLHRDGHLRIPARAFADERNAIRAEIETKGYNERLGSYVTTFDGNTVDASLLLLALYGYTGADAPRMRGTCRLIYERLGTGPLLHRYREPDGLPGPEGAFGIASFWGVETRARMGEVDAATADFERLCAFANDLGLFAEEIHHETGEALGNFPQAFTHVGLINAALALAGAAGRPSGRPSELPGVPDRPTSDPHRRRTAS